MKLHPAEQATVRAFVAPRKRDRMVSLLASGKRRKEALDALNHFAAWDPRYATPLPSTANVLQVLRDAGAPGECHMISEDRTLDGRDMPLADAVVGAEVFPFASVLCCVPGRLAVYFGETTVPRPRVLLCRGLGESQHNHLSGGGDH